MYFFFCFEIIGYVEDIKQLMFSMTKQERDNVGAKYKAKIPDPLNHQFLECTSIQGYGHKASQGMQGATDRVIPFR